MFRRQNRLTCCPTAGELAAAVAKLATAETAGVVQAPINCACKAPWCLKTDPTVVQPAIALSGPIFSSRKFS